MCSGIINWLSILLMCFSGCSCKRWAAGFTAGGESQLEVSSGIAGLFRRDSNGGFVLVSDGDATLGANWKGGAYGGGYSSVDNKYYGRHGVATGQLSGTIKPGLHLKVGRDGQGNWHREFKPRISVSNNTQFTGNSYTDAKTLAAVYGDDKAIKDQAVKVEDVIDEANNTTPK